ncbi:MAG: AMP-binding protein [Gammaproteobacteria bacterium]|nr:AMP-binding protein [Gammaproteobacteria bacterium]
MTTIQRWWTPDLVSDVIQSIIAREWAHLRPGEPVPTLMRTPINDLSFGADGLGADSLEIVQLATAVSTFFQMQHAGIDDYLLMRRTLHEWTDIVCQSLQQHDLTIGFRSSGSTGEAKLSVHSIEFLQQEIAYWSELLRDSDRIVGVVPRHHIYGFIFTVLLPRALSVEFIDASGRTPNAVARELTNRSVLIAYPDYWQIVDKAEPNFPEGVIGISSTAPCPDWLADSLVPKALGKLYQIYGSTETAGIGWRDSSSASYSLLPMWTRIGPRELQCRGDAGAFSLQDNLVWTDEEHFEINGRHDNAVQIGGMNVYPERIANTLKRLPYINDVAVRPMQQHEGSRLKAFIVPHESQNDMNQLRTKIARYIDESLSAVERPRSITFGTQLPMNELGKPADWQIDQGGIYE